MMPAGALAAKIDAVPPRTDSIVWIDLSARKN
jgi:hypothetical protein